MTTSNKTRAALKINSGIKAGGLGSINHNRRGLKVVSGVKAGGFTMNHNRALLAR